MSLLILGCLCLHYAVGFIFMQHSHRAAQPSHHHLFPAPQKHSPPVPSLLPLPDNMPPSCPPLLNGPIPFRWPAIPHPNTPHVSVSNVGNQRAFGNLSFVSETDSVTYIEGYLHFSLFALYKYACQMSLIAQVGLYIFFIVYFVFIVCVS